MGASATVTSRASLERALAALSERGCHVRVRGDHVDAQCPAHDDRSPSLSLDWKPGDGPDGGRTDVHCHGGCRNEDIAAALGVSLAELIYDVPLERGLTPGPRRASTRPTRTSPRRSERLPGREPECRHQYRQVAAYRYVEADGVMVGEALRKKCAKCDGKTFTWRRPTADGGWEFKAPESRPLYRLPELRAARDADAGVTVYVVEGEKDVDRLREAGAVAACNPGGAGKWRPEHTAALTGAVVVVIADHDGPGYRHAADVRDALAGVASSVTVVRGLVDDPHADVSDHLAAGYGLADLEPVPDHLLSREVTPLPDTTSTTARTTRTRPVSDVDDGQDDGDAESGPIVPWDSIEVQGSPGYRYSVTRGRVWKLTGSGRNREWSVVLLWCPEVLERLVTHDDDGAPACRYYSVKVGADSVLMSHPELRTGEVWDKLPDAPGVGVKAVREMLSNVITHQCMALERITAVTRTGWHTLVDGARVYVWPDGRLTASGSSAQVRLAGAPPKLVEAGRPAPRMAGDDEILVALIGAGYRATGPLIGVGAGARSFGQSIRAVPAALVVHGDPASGKSLTGWFARTLAVGSGTAWPPLSTSSFTATRTDMECALDTEADMPTLVDDLALTRDAPAIEVREANAKLEGIIRPLANGTEIRGRRRMDLTRRPGNYVRSIPIITAQSLPSTMQASLYRRAVLQHLKPGDADVRWFATNGAGLVVPLRTLGMRIVDWLASMDRDAADAALAELDAHALSRFAPFVDAALPGWQSRDDGMDGVVRQGAAMLSGLLIVADRIGLTGDDRYELFDLAAGPLAASLAAQADTMADRASAADDLGTAVSEVVVAALLSGHAHVRDDHGDLVGPIVPGLTEQAHGLRRGADGGWNGSGAALYWLPDRDAVAVRSAELHAILAGSRDQRVQGFTARSLPAALLRAGASLPSHQARHSATHEIRIGASGNRQYVLLRPGVIGLEPEQEISLSRNAEFDHDNHDNHDSTGQRLGIAAGTTTTPENHDNAGQSRTATPDAVALENRENAPTSDVVVLPADVVVPVETASERPVGAVASSSDQTPAAVDGGAVSGSVAPSGVRFRAVAVVVDADGAYLADSSTAPARIALPDEVRTLGELRTWARGLRLGHQYGQTRTPPADGQLWLMPSAMRRFGLPASLPVSGGRRLSGRHEAVKSLEREGWKVGTAGVGPWSRTYRTGERTLLMVVPAWFKAGKDGAASPECELWHAGMSAAALARRIHRSLDTVRVPFVWSGAATGAELMEVNRQAGRMAVTAAVAPAPCAERCIEVDWSWDRELTPDEADMAYVHVYDANAMYLAVTSSLRVGLNAPEYREAPQFDPAVPGYWLADLEELVHAWRDGRLPNLLVPSLRVARTRAVDGLVPLCTPTLAQAQKSGITLPAIREAYLYTEHGRYLEPWNEMLRDARARVLAEIEANPDDADASAIRALIQRMYRGGIGRTAAKDLATGKLKSDPRDPLYRPDWWHHTVSASRSRLAYKLDKVAREENRFPLAVSTDAVAYASNDPNPITACPRALGTDRTGRDPVGTALGQVKHYASGPMSAVLEARAAGRDLIATLKTRTDGE
jgi:hypothetical protein